MEIEFEKIIENVRVIDSSRNYWFIRTYSGNLFKEYLENNYVGVGFNKVPFNLIKKGVETEENAQELALYIDANTRYKKGESTKWANQLLEFEHSIKNGDVIFMPSEYSNKFAIGIVRSKTFLVKEPGKFKLGDVFEEYPEKRKKIEWINIINRADLNFDVRSLISTHQAVSSANQFSDYLESTISDIFIKDERVNFTIRFNQENDISIFALNDFLSNVVYFYKEFAAEAGAKSENEFTIKIKVQSKGSVFFKVFVASAAIGIAGMIAMSNHNTVKVKLPFNTEISGGSDGFLSSLSDFLDRSQERKIRYKQFEDSLDQLKATIGVQDTINQSDTIQEETIIRLKDED